ncbi:HET-domain-containing protein [Venturia nashicola]|uniref:HET-domain-containing protein n=1 Tax=Venturia nashicola TaxID=86259 RepID=A0A4Z1PL55_9PEZI|nr:HET-domain-containing protein [Venturia nashicola]TLD35915.1 HET-domain-containing protein [Venturia nashicola]
MRLINTTTFKLHEFVASDVPRYAILSHSWNDREVSFEQLQSGLKNEKMERFCAQARRDGLQFGWVDTFCLHFQKQENESDETIKKEHEKAINSMYTWFANAEVCYAYLEDVDIKPELDTEGRRNAVQQALLSSHWFTSGWTLIELIAPPRVEFYQADWTKFGTKKSMRGIVSKITGIPQEVLTGLKDRSQYPIWERMGWARHRMTSGLEDQAYCLMGLFEVTMKLDYTEGSNAFLRLREEIKRVHGASCLDQPAAPLRLLRIDSLTVESHPRSGGRIPDYAILSHTWDDDEITFQDIQSGVSFAERKKFLMGRKRLSYDKIIGCCELAERNGFEYVWIDTCCIDRTSSSELQEAICSMWRWYKNAKVCYAYLVDYTTEQDDSLWACKWFGRGWTLQELIAPEIVEFYDVEWSKIGTKASLCMEIALITQIDTKILLGADPRKRSIAERMSWAASRATSRLEDVAYCLMGLFDVNMPMLYGEGTRAFIRLQEEIISRTEDYTIFAWTADPLNNMPRGLFASFPADFKLSGRSFAAPEGLQKPRHGDAGSRYIRVNDQHEQPPNLTSRGLLINLPRMSMVKVTELGPDTYLAWICSIDSEATQDGTIEELMICIALQQLQDSKPKKFVRLHPRHLFIRPRSLFEEKFSPRTMYCLSAGKPENNQ